MSGTYIKSESDQGVLILTMHDPKTRNAIGLEMMKELEEEIDRFESSPALRALVLTGSDPSFCSGANVKTMNDANESSEAKAIPGDSTPWDLLNQAWDKQSALNARPKDLIEGIALSCDIRFASTNAKFSEMFVRRGLIPADGSCWQLPRMIGLGKTFMLQYTGEIVSAEESLELGIVNKVTPHEQLMNETMDLANRIASGATYSMALIKKLIHESLHTNLEESLKLAGPAQDIARQTSDHKEGVKAFVEKRKPNFTGR